MKLSEYNFRDIYRHCVILKGGRVYSGAKEMLTGFSYTVPAGMDAALCFCFIDKDAGMSFHFLCLANFETGEIDEKSYEKLMEEKSLLTFRASPDFEIKLFEEDVSTFSYRLNIVDEGYREDKSVLPTRDITEIDHLRNSCFPDDIQVLLLKEGLESELPWFRLREIKDRKLYGALLNEPHQNFGVHINDVVEIGLGIFENKVYAYVNIPPDLSVYKEGRVH